MIEACQVGVYAADATSILIEGSVIESVGVPIMLMVRSHPTPSCAAPPALTEAAQGCEGCTITSSYFEGNHAPPCKCSRSLLRLLSKPQRRGRTGGPITMQPVYDNISAPAFNITADIVINGESCTGKEGNSDYKKWKPNPLAGCAPPPFRPPT